MTLKKMTSYLIMLIVLLIAALAVAVVSGAISPSVSLQLAGSKENITHVFMENAADQNDTFQLITNDKEEIRNLFQDITLKWNTSLLSAPENEEHYFIYFDDDQDPLQTGHNGYVTYYPQSNRFAYYNGEGHSMSLQASEVLRQFVARTIK